MTLPAISRTRFSRILAAVAATGALAVFATTPATHNVTVPTNPGDVVVVEWTGTSPPGAAGGANFCITSPAADSHNITLSVPAGTYDTVKVTAAFHIEWDDDLQDLVLSVEQDGSSVGDSDGGEPQENVSVTNPEAGVYEAITCSFAAGLPTPFRGKLTLTASANLPDADKDGVPDVDDACPDTPRFTLVEDDGCPFQRAAGMPQYFNYYAPDGVASNVGEPSIGCNWLSEQTFTNTNTDGSTNSIANGGTTTFFGGFQPVMLKITFDDCPSPANAIWEEKPLVAAGTIRPLGDPILFTDHDTGRTWVIQLEPGAGATIDYTDNDGDDFIPSTGPFASANDFDHETIAAGPYHAPLTGTNPIYQNAVYYAVQGVSEAVSFRSDDGGATFNAKVPMYVAADCTGLHGHLKVAPNDGTVYIPPRACAVAGVPLLNGGNAAVVMSEDNGITWKIRTIPHDSAATDQFDDPSIGIATDGTVYIGFHGADGHPRISVSKDMGLTWSVPYDVGAVMATGGPVVNIAFPEVVAGDPDRAAFAFFGTETPGADYSSAGFPGVWYLYVATTFDGGLTWSTQNITPGDPIQRGGICGGGTCRNLLDFFDATIDKEGRVLIAGEDGCVSTNCIDGGANDFTAKGFIGRQAGGKRMYAAFDPVEPARPSAPALNGTLNADSTVANLTWGVPDNGASPITAYKVYRREDTGPFTLLATAPGNSYSDTTYDDTVETFYHVTAVNAVGEGPYCLDFSPTFVDLGNLCVPPGVTKLTDSPGTGGTAPVGSAGPGMDLLSLQLSQEFAADGNVKLAFRLNTDPGQVPQPTGTAWYVSFKLPGGAYKGVRMEWQAAAPNVPTFLVYVPGANSGGGVDGRFVDSTAPADPASSYDAANGHITIVASLSDLGLLPGEVIAGFNAGVTETSDPGGIGAGATATIDEMPNGLVYTGDYLVRENAFCAPNLAPNAKLSATPTSGPAPLTVEFDASLSNDPDDGDSIAGYIFDFGDERGSEQATPVVSHTYVSEGTYTAVVRVRDNRGLTSTNVEEKVITVTAGSTATSSALDNTRLAGSLSALGLLVLGLAGLRRRRRKPAP